MIMYVRNIMDNKNIIEGRNDAIILIIGKLLPSDISRTKLLGTLGW